TVVAELRVVRTGDVGHRCPRAVVLHVPGLGAATGNPADQRARREVEVHSTSKLVHARCRTIGTRGVAELVDARNADRIGVLPMTRGVVELRGDADARLEEDLVGERVGPRNLLQSIRLDPD